MNLNQVTIPSVDLIESIRFYEKIGLKLIVKTLPRYARYECPDGDSTFSIHKVNKLPIGDGKTIYFENENLDEYIKDLIQEGIEFEELPNDKRWFWREAKLKDPDGNQLILFYGWKNQKYPPWRIELN